MQVRGHAVAPAELEDLLPAHLAVADVAVIGIPDEASGELPCAFIVPSYPSELEATLVKEIQGFIEARKPRYKRLAGVVTIVRSIPKSASGKILRRVLKDQWNASQGRVRAPAKAKFLKAKYTCHIEKSNIVIVPGAICGGCWPLINWTRLSKNSPVRSGRVVIQNLPSKMPLSMSFDAVQSPVLAPQPI